MDSEATRPLQAVPDEELLQRLAELVSQSRRVEADLVAHIGEVHARRLYARQAFPSMFVYCTEKLHLSEAEAYRRITAARAARKHPGLLTMLRDGRLHLSGIALLAPFLTANNRDELLERATHFSKRQIEELLAALSPAPDVPALIRRLPQKRVERAGAVVGPHPAHAVELVPGRVAASSPPADPGRPSVSPPPAPPASLPAGRSLSSRASVEPLAPARYKVQFTASAALREKLERLTALLRSDIPDGDLAQVIEQAVTEKLERLEARRFAKTAAPRRTLAQADTSAASRHVPAAVRRAVRERDGDRCRFVDDEGRRCSGRQRLEFHHRHPFGMGGDHSLTNISLLCPQHNRQIAERDYGTAKVRGNAGAGQLCSRDGASEGRPPAAWSLPAPE
jgi:hypothetical protein